MSTDSSSLFHGFTSRFVRTSGARIHLASGGDGEPVLLLHGYPQTHVCWHKIAPRLAKRYAVVCADLRGYGKSSKPRGLADHSNYSKRAMAQDMVEVMASLGFERFHLVGHDRGARVAHRLAIDHADRVHTLTVLDISPTLKMFESCDMTLARAYYHWYLMLQPPPLPEQLLAGNVPLYILGRVGRDKPDLSGFSKKALDEYISAFADPRAIHASCEDYRAAGTIDLEHDRVDRGRRITMPVLALWGAKGLIERHFHCIADWREVAEDVTGQALDCGHFLPEEAPAETLAQIERFLARHPLPAASARPTAGPTRGRAVRRRDTSCR